VFLKNLVDMFRFPFVIFMLVLSLFSAKLLAIEVRDLYQSNVVVESQDRVQRENAIKQALQSVLLKVGGKKSVLTHDVLKGAQKRATRYVSQYRYQRKKGQLSLVVSFNEDKVNKLFKDANLALWGSLRPQVLLWLIDEQGVSRSIVASDANTVIATSINDFSTQRGLPIITPLMDLTDSENVVLSDFWGYFPEQIQQASLRYFADTIVVMRVSDSSLVPRDELVNIEASSQKESCGLLCDKQDIITPKVLDWRVFTQGVLYTQKYQGLDRVSLINQGLSDITDLIYQSYALSTTAENDFVIEVKNVTSLKNDILLFNFLSDLSAVKAVSLTSAQGDVRQFKLDLIGSRASFLATLKLNNKLTQQLDGLSHTNQFTDQFTNQMKTVVLGEPQTIIVDETSVPIVNGSLDDSTVNLVASTQDNNSLNAKPATNLNKNEELPILTETTPPLKIVPQIPVFYWEQG